MTEYIERDMLCRVLERYRKAPKNRYQRGVEDGMELALNAIKAIHAADVALVVHGCFEPCFDENGNWRQGFAKCSNCGKEYYAQVINYFGYCPNCGARVVRGDE